MPTPITDVAAKGVVAQDDDVNALDIDDAAVKDVIVQDDDVDVLNIDNVPLNQLKQQHHSRVKSSTKILLVQQLIHGII